MLILLTQRHIEPSVRGTKAQRGIGEDKKPASVSPCLRAFVRCLCVSFLVLFSFAACNQPPGEGGTWDPGALTWQEAQPLHEIYRSYFKMGNIISPSDLNNTTRLNLLKHHYNTVTAENHMKPDNLAPASRPTGSNWESAYSWTNADNIVNAARNAEIDVIGHTLIWHSQSRSWMTSGGKDTAISNLENHVTTVVNHFKDKGVSTWDVVNEAFRDGLGNAGLDGSDWRACLRKTGVGGISSGNIDWNTAIGDDYIERAFLAARAADPNAKLYYNDYNLNDTNLSNPKTYAAYNMVKEINEKYPNVGGRPLIDGIGMQSHHHINTTVESVKSSIEMFTSLGVEIAISELDIMAADDASGQSGGWGSWSDDNAQKQARLYSDLFKLFMNSPKVVRVTFWGLDDGTSWRTRNYPTLLNSDFSLKPAFQAVYSP